MFSCSVILLLLLLLSIVLEGFETGKLRMTDFCEGNTGDGDDTVVVVFTTEGDTSWVEEEWLIEEGISDAFVGEGLSLRVVVGADGVIEREGIGKGSFLIFLLESIGFDSVGDSD